MARMDDDVVTIQRYSGKTNEAFTHLLVNVALAESDGRFARLLAGEPVRLLDPACGRGTSLNRAVVYGMDACGIELDQRDVEAYAQFILTWMKDKRLKHQLEQAKLRQGPGHAGPPGHVTYGRGKDRSHPPGGRHHPRRHGRRSHPPQGPHGRRDRLRPPVRRAARRARRRRPGVDRGPGWRCCAAALPVWCDLLRPGGAMALAWNRYTLDRAGAGRARARRRLRAPVAGGRRLVPAPGGSLDPPRRAGGRSFGRLSGPVRYVPRPSPGDRRTRMLAARTRGDIVVTLVVDRDQGLQPAARAAVDAGHCRSGLAGRRRGASLGAGAIHAAAIGVHSEHRQAVVVFTIVAARPARLRGRWPSPARCGSLLALGALANVGTLRRLGRWPRPDGIWFVDGLEAPRSPCRPPTGSRPAWPSSPCSPPASPRGVRRRATRSIDPPLPGTGGAAVLVAALAVPGMLAAGTARRLRDGHGHELASTDAGGEAASAVPPKPYDPALPIDLGGVEGVTPAAAGRGREPRSPSRSLRLPQVRRPRRRRGAWGSCRSATAASATSTTSTPPT